MMDEELRALLSGGSMAYVRLWVIDVCGGDLKAAMILDKLMWWAKDHEDRPGSRWGAEHEGYWWTAMSYDNWWNDLRINTHSAKRAVRALKEKGFVVTAEFMFFDTKKLHLRVIEKNVVNKAREYGLCVPQLSRQPRGKRASQPEVRIVPPQEDETYSPHKEERTTERTPAPEKSGAEGRAKPQQKKPRETEENQPPEGVPGRENVVVMTDREGEWKERQAAEAEIVKATDIGVLRMKAHEALKKDLAKNAHSKGRKNYTVSGQTAAILWKKHLHLATGEFVQGFTHKDQAAIKRLVEVIQIAIPLGNAIDVLDWVLSNWGLFAHKVGVEKGSAVGSAPSQPNLYFLLAHHATAVNAYNAAKRAAVVGQPSSQPSVPEPKPEPTVAPAAEASAQPKEDVHIVTPQEMEEAMKEFDTKAEAPAPAPSPVPQGDDDTSKAA